jgi:hypothetical protein
MRTLRGEAAIPVGSCDRVRQAGEFVSLSDRFVGHMLVIYNHPRARSPRGQSDIIDPFVKWSAGGILIELKLNADHVGPG